MYFALIGLLLIAPENPDMGVTLAIAPWIIPAVGTLLSTGSSLYNSAKDRLQSQSNLSSEIAYNKEAATLAHQRNLESWEKNRAWEEEMWHMSNTYNSPQAQMARLKQAGINPRLVYGSSGATGGMSSPMSSSSPAPYKWETPNFSQVKPFHVTGDGIGSYVDLKAKQAQVDAIEAQADLTQQKAATEAINTALKAHEEGSGNASRYYWNRSWKMHDDRDISRSRGIQEGALAEYSMEMAMEKLNQLRLDNQNKSNQINLTAEQVIGQRIKNEYEGKGISTQNMKLIYNQLKDSGMDQEAIASTLLFAGVSAEALQYVLPAGIIGKALRNVRVPKAKRPRYNSAESWRDLDRRLTPNH